MSAQPTQIRLNKFLAARLGVSRREADELITAGQVLVNGHPAILGTRVSETDEVAVFTPKKLAKKSAPRILRGQTAAKSSSKSSVKSISTSTSIVPGATTKPTPDSTPIDKNDKVCYNKKIVPFQTDFLYLAFHKPVGYVCSRRAQGPAPTLYELLPPEYQGLKTVGRLDKDSSGLILLTNDGDFAYKMTHPKFKKEKIYEVALDKPISAADRKQISTIGVELDDGVSKFSIFEDPLFQPENFASGYGPKAANTRTGVASPVQAREATHVHDDPAQHLIVTLTEGRNRQIRRTFAALGYQVTRLHRTKFGQYLLNNLKPGKFEELQKK